LVSYATLKSGFAARFFLRELASFEEGRHLNEKAQNCKNPWICTAPQGFTQNSLNFLDRGLDESREVGILTDGLGVDQAFRGITVGSKKVLPSVRPSEGQEVDPIVRFFTSTG
jgi:hypothetical protein